jgi:uncharacterized protein
MPHQCVRCGSLYDDGSKELLSGCTCGGKFFFYIRKRDMSHVQKATETLTVEDREQMEHDALELVGESNIDKPVILDLENVRVLKPGKFEIDLVDLFKGKPLVYKLEDGKYIIDVASTFAAGKKGLGNS